MNKYKLADLIDQYLMGTLSAEDKAHLESLAASDPEVARMIQESRRAFRALQAEQHRRLRKKLQQWDDENTAWRRYTPRWGLSALAALFVVAGLIWWTFHHFNPGAMARRHFERDFPGATVNTEAMRHWEEACLAFGLKEYETALYQHTILLGLLPPEEAWQVHWNMLMIRLAREGPTPTWKIAFEEYIQSAPEAWSPRGRAVLKEIESPVFRLIFSSFSASLSGFTPRII